MENQSAPTPPIKKQNPMDMLTKFMLTIPGKLKNLMQKKTTAPEPVTPQPAPGSETLSTPEPPQPKLPKVKISKKAIVIAVVVLVLLIILMIVIRIIGNGGASNVFPISTPTPSPSPTPMVEVPSQYADDEDVLKIQAAMQDLDKQLNEAAFRDDRLRIPTLDWDVSFE